MLQPLQLLSQPVLQGPPPSTHLAVRALPYLWAEGTPSKHDGPTTWHEASHGSPSGDPHLDEELQWACPLQECGPLRQGCEAFFDPWLQIHGSSSTEA